MTFARKINNISRELNALPNKIAAEAVLFSKDRFRAENWVDNTTKPWTKRKPTRESKQRSKRGILRDTGKLMRSVRKIHVSRNLIIIGTDVPYAQVHNEGFRGTVNVPLFKRKRPERSKKKGLVTVKAHKKKLNMPQRQFMGNSAVLTKKLERLMLSSINNAIR